MANQNEKKGKSSSYVKRDKKGRESDSIKDKLCNIGLSVNDNKQSISTELSDRQNGSGIKNKGQRPTTEYQAEKENLTEENYVERAENVITGMNVKLITTTKIRSFLSMAADIYNEIRMNKVDSEYEDEDKSKIFDRIRYLKVRIIYEAGRDFNVKKFIERAGIIKTLDQALAVSDEEQFMLFYKYMEALVAYHRYYGGRDE